MIRVSNLSKYFASKRALGPVSFEIATGETVGFLGLNGAGKTTALRILACDLRPTSGNVSVGAVDAITNPHDVRKQIGFLPETPPLYFDMTVENYLNFAGQLRGMSSTQIKARLGTVLELTDLTEAKRDPIGSLSHGYRQRVGVAQAIIHEPSLLILDEPTRGLDPVQIVEMRNLIQELKKQHTVLISSHILTEISQTCDRLLVLGKGEIIASGDEAELSSRLAETQSLATGDQEYKFVIAIRSGESEDMQMQATSSIEAVDGVTNAIIQNATGSELAFLVTSTGDKRAEVNQAIVHEGHQVVRLEAYHRPSTDTRTTNDLESIFLNLVNPGAP